MSFGKRHLHDEVPASAGKGQVAKVEGANVAITALVAALSITAFIVAVSAVSQNSRAVKPATPAPASATVPKTSDGAATKPAFNWNARQVGDPETSYNSDNKIEYEIRRYEDGSEYRVEYDYDNRGRLTSKTTHRRDGAVTSEEYSYSN